MMMSYLIIIATIIVIVYCIIKRYSSNKTHDAYEKHGYVDTTRKPITPAANNDNDALRVRTGRRFIIGIL